MEAYRLALQEMTRERVPLDWAIDADEPRRRALRRLASARRGRSIWRRQWRPIGWRCRS